MYPLLSAAINGHLEACELLIENDTMPDNNILIEVALRGHIEVIQLLMDNYELDIHKEYEEGTVLHYAAGRGHTDLCKMLIDEGADVSHIDQYEHIPLHYAACSGHANTCKLLIDEGSNPNAMERDQEQMTPLLLAIKYSNSLSTCKALLDGGADPNLTDGGGMLPLSYAIDAEKKRICKLLISRGGVADAEGGHGGYENDDMRDYIRSIGEDPSCIVEDEYWDK